MPEEEEFEFEIISDEELSIFEETQLEEKHVEEMKILNKEMFYKKVNKDAIKKVKDILDEDEEIDFYFTGVDIKANNAKTALVLISHTSGYTSSDWGINSTVVFTNKRLFIIQRNNFLQYLKHSEISYEDIKEIQLYKKNNIMELKYKTKEKKQVEFPGDSFELIYKLVSEKIEVKINKGSYLSVMDKFSKIYFLLSLIVGVAIYIFYIINLNK